MAQPAGPSRLARLSELPLARIIAYYVLLVAGGVLLARLFPALGRSFSGERIGDLVRLGGGHAEEFSALARGAAEGPVMATGPLGPAAAAGLAMVGASLLMLPVAWIYTMTRQKKGYRQSTVQTLLILPAVVAGVVILVKNSLALAFSLAGIVAAINFRSTLRDTKDAVYIFLAMVIGLAAGVQSMPVALAVSLVFNLVVLVLAWTDFGRSPAALEGARARARLERARALAAANRTGMFVSVVEREILKSLSPEQLDVLAERARRLRARAAIDEAPNGRPLDTVIRVYAADPDAARPAVEAVLAESVKAWRFGGVVGRGDGARALEYQVRLRKKIPASDVLARLQERGAPAVLRAELG